MRLLLADDESELTSALCEYLQLQNYIVDVTDNGTDSLQMAENVDYDAIILDITMPGMNGLEVLSTLREQGNQTPVIMISGKGELEDRLRGFELGADDYLPKPFAMIELAARIKANTRRKTILLDDFLSFGEIRLNSDLCQLEYKEKANHLSTTEYQIIELLMRNPDSLVSGNQMLKKIWGSDPSADVNIVCVYITYLRRKLKALNAPVRIKSVRGAGYKLCEA